MYVIFSLVFHKSEMIGGGGGFAHFHALQCE